MPSSSFDRRLRRLAMAALGCCAAAAAPAAPAAPPACLSECTPRIGIVSAFGREAELLLARVEQPRVWLINGNRYTTGVLEGHRVAIVLSGVSMINSTLVTQQMLNHFRIERLVMSGIAGGVNPAHHVGDVTVPDRWAMPLEVYWNADNQPPAPCGSVGDVSCLGLRLARPERPAATAPKDAAPYPAYAISSGSGLSKTPAANPTQPHPASVPTGLFMRENFVMNAANAPQGEFRFDYPVDPAMLAVARSLQPELARCGGRARQADGSLNEALCVKQAPRLIVGGRGVSATVFLANADYRRYLFETLQAQTFEMETAALAHVAYANQVPYIAFRSLSDLAGADGFNAEVGALFSSGLAEENEAKVTLAFLRAWRSDTTSAAMPALPSSSSSPALAKASPSPTSPRAVKVLVITMFQPEAQGWLAPFHLDEAVPVPGLPPESPALRCNAEGVCLMVAGMGHANVAASVMAATLDTRFDFSRTWFLVAGIAGIDPAQGTLGSAAWARWLVDFGIAHEIDAREMPKSWSTGYLGVLTQAPGEMPKLEYKAEVARLDEALLQKALSLSRGLALEDSPAAKAYRALYREKAARAAPGVLQCDTLGGDTWWHGHLLGQRARDWTKLLTGGQGRYCTTQQEDNATYAALARAAAAGRLDLKRLAVLRTGANFDRPHPGQTAAASLVAGAKGGSGAFLPATQNLVLVGGALVRDIVANWQVWKDGVPAP